MGGKLAFLLEIILLVNRELIRTLRPKLRLSHTMRNYPAVQAKPTETEPCFITADTAILHHENKHKRTS